jgi:DNA-binding beta-propeller fold protein YncE
LTKPTSLTVNGDLVLVGDLKENVIQVYSRITGAFIDEFGQQSEDPSNNLYLPSGMAMDPEGAVYISNIGTGKIVKFDIDGHDLLAFGGMGTNQAFFSRPRGLAADEKGRIYVVDGGHQNVQVFSNAGRLLMFFGDKETMRLPSGIAITTENLDYYQTLAEPGFKLDRVLLVTSQFGNQRLGIYGMGKMEGIDYDAEYAAIRDRIEKTIQEEKRILEEQKSRQETKSQ